MADDAPRAEDIDGDIYGGTVLRVGNHVSHFTVRPKDPEHVPPDIRLQELPRDPLLSEYVRNAEYPDKFHPEMGRTKQMALLLSAMAPQTEQDTFYANCMPLQGPLVENGPIFQGLDHESQNRVRRAKVLIRGVLDRGGTRAPFDQDGWVPIMIALGRLGSIDARLGVHDLLQLVFRYGEGRIQIQLRYHMNQHNQVLHDMPSAQGQRYEVYIRKTPVEQLVPMPHNIWGLRLTVTNHEGIEPCVHVLYPAEFAMFLREGQLSPKGPPNFNMITAVQFYCMGMAQLPGQHLQDPPLTQYVLLLNVNEAINAGLEMYYGLNGKVYVCGPVPIQYIRVYDMQGLTNWSDVRPTSDRPYTFWPRAKEYTVTYQNGRWEAFMNMNANPSQEEQAPPPPPKAKAPPPPPPEDPPDDWPPRGQQQQQQQQRRRRPPPPPPDSDDDPMPKAPPPKAPPPRRPTEGAGPDVSHEHQGPDVSQEHQRESRGVKMEKNKLPPELTLEDLQDERRVMELYEEYNKYLGAAVSSENPDQAQVISTIRENLVQLWHKLNYTSDSYVYERDPDASMVRVPRVYVWDEMCQEVKKQFEEGGLNERNWSSQPISGYWNAFKYILMGNLRFNVGATYFRVNPHYHLRINLQRNVYL